MKSLLAVAVISAALAPAAYADCTYPQAPKQIPDGATATRDQMLAAQKAVQAFNEQITAYQACIKLERDSIVAQQGGKLTKQQKQQLTAIALEKNNAAYDQVKALADQFNTQLKIFEARNKKSDD
jgi:hypothetical protein